MKRIILGLMSLSTFLTSILFAQPSFANDPFSYESLNFPNRYIRHRNFNGYLEPTNSALDRKDATFKEDSGLADSNCTSFQSLNFPGRYLRHQNLRIVLSLNDGSNLFKKDATFCLRDGLYGQTGISFESYNFRGHFIRHKNFELWIDPSDGSDLFRKDATFYRSTPLWR